MNSHREAVLIIAQLMVLAARTAPKARGTDAIVTRIISGKDLTILADEMRHFGDTEEIEFFIRDAQNIADSDACVLIGARGESVVGINCGGCGYATCQEMQEAQSPRLPGEGAFNGPNCVVRMADLGIAIGSAIKTASIHNVDNRIMYSAGVGALRIGLLEDCFTAYAIPLKASGKNIYFDRSR